MLLLREPVFTLVERRIESEWLIDGLAGEHGPAMGAMHETLSFKAREVTANARRRGREFSGQVFNRRLAVAQQQPEDFLGALIGLGGHSFRLKSRSRYDSAWSLYESGVPALGRQGVERAAHLAYIGLADRVAAEVVGAVAENHLAVPELRGTFGTRAERGVHLAHPCREHQFAHIVLPNTAAGQQRDSACRTVDEAGEAICAANGVALASGGENAICTRGDHVFKRGIHVNGDIEGAMKRDPHGPCRGNQLR